MFRLRRATSYDRRAMREVTDLQAAVVGTGFIGLVHVDALRRLGVSVLGVVGSSPERVRTKKTPVPLPEPYESFDAMLADDRVDVVHLTTPNHLHYSQARATLEAGKHVVCEKPLALDSEQSAELLQLAQRRGLVHCTNFNIRFYPQCHEARALIAGGRVGDVWNVHGGYLQDWLLLPTDWNWRLEPDKGGPLRAVADIGSHWLDIVQFVTGRRVTELFADLATTIPVRRRPAAEVETFAAAGDVDRVDTPMATEDVAHLLVRFDGGARGSAVISQVSAGRRNSLRFEVDGSAGSLYWDAERHEELWLGHRDRPNETLTRDPSLLEPDAAKRTSLPAGHAEGFADTFKELYRAVYANVAAETMPAEADFPTFADGHWANVLGDAVAASAGERRWVEVPA
jgi:predicted dehydrogenase